MNNSIFYNSGMAFVNCSCGHELNLHYVQKCEDCSAYICIECKTGSLCKRCYEKREKASRFVGFDLAKDQDFVAYVEVKDGKIHRVERCNSYEELRERISRRLRHFPERISDAKATGYGCG